MQCFICPLLGGDGSRSIIIELAPSDVEEVLIGLVPINSLQELDEFADGLLHFVPEVLQRAPLLERDLSLSTGVQVPEDVGDSLLLVGTLEFVATEDFRQTSLELSQCQGSISIWTVDLPESLPDVREVGNKELQKLQNVVGSFCESRPPMDFGLRDLYFPSAIRFEELPSKVEAHFVRGAHVEAREDPRVIDSIHILPASRNASGFELSIRRSICSDVLRVPHVLEVVSLASRDVDQKTRSQSFVCNGQVERKLGLLRLNEGEERNLSESIPKLLHQVRPACELHSEDLLVPHVHDAKDEANEQLGSHEILQKRAHEFPKLHGGDAHPMGQGPHHPDFRFGIALCHVETEQDAVERLLIQWLEILRSACANIVELKNTMNWQDPIGNAFDIHEMMSVVVLVADASVVALLRNWRDPISSANVGLPTVQQQELLCHNIVRHDF
mmetsp:Transcript_79425/g.164895  ORF Transcript_79425/g.164895 Transcript_79425/m.164895 type:complete len:443 (+) Transcript_79425:377-1705(+)